MTERLYKAKALSFSGQKEEIIHVVAPTKERAAKLATRKLERRGWTGGHMTIGPDHDAEQKVDELVKETLDRAKFDSRSWRSRTTEEGS